MLPPETDDVGNIGQHAQLNPHRIVTIPDVDTLEARIARIETLVAELHTIIVPLSGMVAMMQAEIAEKGPIGMAGILISAMRSGG